MSSKSPLVPKLRFPDFRGTGGWAIPKLGSIGFFTGGGTPSKDKTDYWIGVNPWVSSSDVFEDGIHDISISRYISDEAVQATATKVVPANSILLVSRVGVGKLAISRTPICTSQDFTNFTPAKDNLVFLAYCIKSLKAKLLAFNQGMAIKGFTKDDVSNLGIPLPKLAEQQKIADCLSSLDELIAAQARKVDALKTHKKGLMQQLFPREGETQPRLRFLEFRDAGEWEDQSIGNIGKVVTGSTPSTAQPAFYGGGIPFVSPADISDMRFVDQTKTTLTQEGYAQTRPIRAGSVLFVCIGSTIGKVAQNIHDCATNQQINAIIPNSKHSEGFVYFALSLASERIALLAGRQAVPIINKSLFSSVRILVPKLPEQHRIASFLSSIETLLTDENQSLELLKAHKKGLMQQIFPSLESISA